MSGGSGMCGCSVMSGGNGICGFQEVELMPSRASFYAIFLDNCGRG